MRRGTGALALLLALVAAAAASAQGLAAEERELAGEEARQANGGSGSDGYADRD